MKIELTSFSCISCGSTIEARRGLQSAWCASCGAKNSVPRTRPTETEKTAQRVTSHQKTVTEQLEKKQEELRLIAQLSTARKHLAIGFVIFYPLGVFCGAIVLACAGVSIYYLLIGTAWLLGTMVVSTEGTFQSITVIVAVLLGLGALAVLPAVAHYALLALVTIPFYVIPVFVRDLLLRSTVNRKRQLIRELHLRGVDAGDIMDGHS